MDNKVKLIIGNFDSEIFWRDANCSKLPTFNDKQTTNIVAAMDEILFPLCRENDIIFTRYKMNEPHKQYLYDIGFRFKANTIDIEPLTLIQEASGKCVFQLLNELDDKSYFKELLPQNVVISPFAVTPHVQAFCNEFMIETDVPDIDIIKKVNSKIYSAEINNKINKNCSKIVFSAEELASLGRELLQTSSFIIKDEYGVSGKGNLHIDSISILERVSAYIGAQERKGKSVRFIVEPFFNKKLDFSCQFSIDTKGEFKLISVQKLLNTNFSYLGSFTADKSFMDMLESNDYFEKMRYVSNELYKSGYYGDVCVDSMVLDDDSIYAIVEVNARKSMSLIKHNIDSYFSNLSLYGSMTNISVSYKNNIKFEDILSGLEHSGLLYRQGKHAGVVPLSANTVLINSTFNNSNDNAQKSAKGRLYLYIVADNQEMNSQLLIRTKEVLDSMEFKIMN